MIDAPAHSYDMAQSGTCPENGTRYKRLTASSPCYNMMRLPRASASCRRPQFASPNRHHLSLLGSGLLKPCRLPLGCSPCRRWSQVVGNGESLTTGADGKSKTVGLLLSAPQVHEETPAGVGAQGTAQLGLKRGDDASAGRAPMLDRTMQRRIATLMGAQFLLSSGYGCIAPVLPALAVHLGVGSTSAGALLSLPAVSRLLLNMPAGRMADDPSIGRRPLMVGGCVTMTVACAGSYCTESLEVLLATRLLFGAGSAFAAAGTAAFIADISHTIPAYRARLMGVQTTMVNLGWVVGPPIAGYVATTYESPYCGFALVCGTAAACTGLLATVPNMPGTPAPADAETENKPTGHMNAVRLLREPGQQGVLALTVGIWTGISAELSVVMQHASVVWDMSPSNLGMLLSFGSVFGMIGGPLGGWFADRYGRPAVLIPAMGAASVSIGGLTLAPSVPVFVALFSTWCCSVSIVMPTLQALAVDITPHNHVGQAQGLHRQAADFAFLSFPPAMGVLADLQRGVLDTGGGCELPIAATAGGIIGSLGLFWLRTRRSCNKSN